MDLYSEQAAKQIKHLNHNMPNLAAIVEAFFTTDLRFKKEEEKIINSIYIRRTLGISILIFILFFSHECYQSTKKLIEEEK